MAFIEAGYNNMSGIHDPDRRLAHLAPQTIYAAHSNSEQDVFDPPRSPKVGSRHGGKYHLSCLAKAYSCVVIFGYHSNQDPAHFRSHSRTDLVTTHEYRKRRQTIQRDLHFNLYTGNSQKDEKPYEELTKTRSYFQAFLGISKVNATLLPR